MKRMLKWEGAFFDSWRREPVRNGICIFQAYVRILKRVSSAHYNILEYYIKSADSTACAVLERH